MSMSICMGLHNWFKTEIEDKKDDCFLRGLTLAHKYYDPEEIKRSFRSIVSGDNACNKNEQCKYNFGRSIGEYHKILSFFLEYSVCTTVSSFKSFSIYIA